MVFLGGGLKVWVVVDEEATKEYMLVHGSDPDEVVHQTSCFIEAKEGKRFRIHFSGLRSVQKKQVVVQVHIDGNLVATRAFCKYEANAQKGSIDGFAEQIGGTAPTIRTFVFGKVQATDEGSVQSESQILKDEGCSIRVDIKVHTRVGRINHIKEQETLYDNNGETIVHKDTKTATLGLLAKAGETLRRKTTLRHCSCEVKPEAEDHQQIVFKYRSTKFLESVIQAEEIRAGRHVKTKLTMEEDGAQEISRIIFEAGAEPVQMTDKSSEGQVHGEEQTSGRQVTPDARTIKRRAGSEPIFDTRDSMTPSRQRLHINPDTLQHIVQAKKIKQEKLDNMAAAPLRLQVDATGDNDDEYTVIKDPPIVIDISDD